MASELFVNSSWTAASKVPKTTPFGVVLTFGVNAFTTLEEAKAYAIGHFLPDPVYHDGDKNVVLDNSLLKISDIRSQEIKPTIAEDAAKGTWSTKSDISAKGAIKVSDSDVVNMKIVGFKDVTISDVGSYADYKVSGGSNKVVHTFIEKNASGKLTQNNSATINGKADGTLTVIGANLTAVDGAWAEATGSNKDSIGVGEAEFNPMMPGDPSKIAWGTPISDSPLNTMCGYSTVKFTDGAYAVSVKGGKLDYSRIADATYRTSDLTLTSLNKSLVYNTAAAGTLDLTDAMVGSAHRYANVNLNGNTEFHAIHGGNENTSYKTTYKYTPSTSGDGEKTTSEYSSTCSVAGTLTAGNLAAKSYSRNVYGYAKVTVVNAELGNVDATNIKEGSKNTYELVSSGTPAEKRTSLYSSFVSRTAGGTLTTGKNNYYADFDRVTGFSNVTLTGAYIVGELAATEAYMTPFSSGFSSELTSSNGILVQNKTSDKYSAAAAGTVTLSEWTTVRGGIFGYQTVKLTNTTVSAALSAGKSAMELTDSFGRSEKNGVVTSNYSNLFKDSKTANGTLAMKSGDLYDAEITGYTAVTLDDVAGGITSATALNITSESKLSTTSVGVIQTFYENSDSTGSSGVGTLTVNNGGGLTISSIQGYNNISLTGAQVKSGIGGGGTYKNSYWAKTTSDTKKDILKNAYSSYESRSVAGTLTLNGGAYVSSGASGYQTMTLDNAYISGSFDDRNIVSMTTTSDEYTDNGGTLLKNSESFSSSHTPTVALTLKNGAYISGNALGIKTLNLNSGTFLSGMADMGGRNSQWTSSYVYDSKTLGYTTVDQSSFCDSAVGTFTATSADVIGNITGAAKITATAANLGELYGLTTSDSSKTITGGSNVNSYTSMSKAGATATLTSTFAGNLVGFGNVKLTGSDGYHYISSANACNSTYTMYEATSTKLYSSTYVDSETAAGTFTANSADVHGCISGYGTVTLDSAYVQEGVGVNQAKTSQNLKITYNGTTRIGQTYSGEYSESPAATLTLKNGAFVANGVDGIKTLNLSASEVGSYVSMGSRNHKYYNNITSNAKTSLYEWKYQDVNSCGTPGTITATPVSYIDSNIDGAGKVTLTDSYVGGNFTCYNSYESTGIVAKGTQLTNEYAGTAIDLDSKFGVEWTEKYSSSSGATGTFTQLRGEAGGIEGYANVKLTGNEDLYYSASVKYAYAGSSKITSSHTYKNNVDIFTSTYVTEAAGKLTANWTYFQDTGDIISGFATVTLTDCVGSGKVFGGNYTEVYNGVGNGANFDTAKNDAESYALASASSKAAGTLTATRTTLYGGIYSMATVTLTDCSAGDVYAVFGDKATLNLAGVNTIGDIGWCTTVNVKSGETAMGSYGGTIGNDSFSVAAGAALTLSDWDFDDGSNKATVNGTVRLLGNLSNSGKLAISGSGIVATTAANYATLMYDLEHGNLGDVSISGSFEFINAGVKESTVRAVRTLKEELADNKASGARKLTGEEITGWLSGEENKDQGKFADTEDWIKFKNDELGTFWVELDDSTRHDDVEVEVWKGGTEIAGAVTWLSGPKWFYIDNTAFAADAEYQLRLTTSTGKAALAYTFHKA